MSLELPSVAGAAGRLGLAPGAAVAVAELGVLVEEPHHELVAPDGPEQGVAARDGSLRGGGALVHAGYLHRVWAVGRGETEEFKPLRRS